jgi:predicted lipoprotein with Yx(FWY)xxD motif
MKRISLLGAIFVLALLLTACGGSGTATPPGAVAPTTAVTEPAMTESPAATEPAGATESAGATEPANSTEAPDATEPAGVPVTGPATVMATNLGTYGPALVDGNGMALYMYIEDTQNSGKSTCNDAECLEEWPPLLSAGQPVAGDSVDASKLGTITRDDGTTQVTYNGWPLYYFYTDTKPGDVTGQGDDNEWYLVSPSGDVIK